MYKSALEGSFYHATTTWGCFGLVTKCFACLVFFYFSLAFPSRVFSLPPSSCFVRLLRGSMWFGLRLFSFSIPDFGSSTRRLCCFRGQTIRWTVNVFLPFDGISCSPYNYYYFHFFRSLCYCRRPSTETQAPNANDDQHKSF